MGFETIVVGVFAPPLDESWLGRPLEAGAIAELARLWKSHGINPAGEGGELETAVLDAPMFGGRIEIRKARSDYRRDSGVLKVDHAEVVPK
jgi:uncharacterized protein (TIGR00290 family)